MNRRLRTLTFSLSLLLLAAARPIHAADGLAYVGTRHDGSSGVNGLRSADALALSPDGTNLYAAGSGDSALAVFSRDAATGALTFVEQERQGSFGVEGLGGASAVAVSPDGLNVYAAGTQDDSLVVFTRDPADGALFFVERERDSVDGVAGLAGVNAVAVSPDGLNVYATGGADSALAVFMRDATSGTLTFLGAETGLNGPQAMAISLDGAQLYVASGNDLVVFARDPESGMLTLVQTVKDNTNGVDGVGGAAALALSPDGAHLYAAGKLDDALAVFARDSASGALSFVEVDRQAVDGVDGLDGVDAVAVSPDGTHVYTAAANANALAVFDRDAATGSLIFVHAQHDAVGDVDGLAGAAALAVSPDGTYVYVAGKSANAVTAFSTLCGDGNLDPGEQCDDGNAANGDGCSAGCRRECVTAPDCNDGDTCTEKRCVSGECALPRCGLDGGRCELRDAEPDLENLAGCTPMRQTLQRALKLRLRQARAQLRAAKHQGICVKHDKHHGPCIQWTKNPSAKDLKKLLKQVDASLATVEDRATTLAKHDHISQDCLMSVDRAVGTLTSDLKHMVLHTGVCAP